MVQNQDAEFLHPHSFKLPLKIPTNCCKISAQVLIILESSIFKHF